VLAIFISACVALYETIERFLKSGRPDAPVAIRFVAPTICAHGAL
jgi:hypothetical protein